jgi:hypothetical protein
MHLSLKNDEHIHDSIWARKEKDSLPIFEKRWKLLNIDSILW